MDTLFYVLDNNYNRIGMIDSFVSLMWCKRYYEIGALDLEVEATEKNLKLFKKGFYIIREDDETVFRIEAVEIDTRDDKDNVMTVGAVDVKTILSQRVITDTINFRGFLQDYIFQILDENLINAKIPARRIDNFTYVRNETILDTIQQQVSHEIVSNKIIELCRSFLLGWKVILENGVFKFSLYKGNDRSDRIVFSQDNDNLLSSKYTQDSTEFKNCVLVAGEGEGDARTKAWVGSVSGLDRFEDIVEESGAKEDLPDIEYLNQLKSKGYELLAEKGRVITFEGDVFPESYRYKVDFDLGDVVKIRNELGIETNTRITEIIEIWDNDGYTLDIKFEYLEFQGALPPVELERELIFSGDPENLTYYAEEHPYGITVEVYAEKGGDGSKGDVNSEYLNANTVKSGDEGMFGYGSSHVNVKFSVDGEPFEALSQGGAGGGGGAGGFSPHPTGGRLSFDVPAGEGGKGANGDVVTIDISFVDVVNIENLILSGRAQNGKPGDGGRSHYIPNPGTSPAPTLLGGSAFNGVTSSTSDGANATPPEGSYCDYPTAKISNTNDTTFKGVKVYTWKEIPIEVEVNRKLATVSAKSKIITSEKKQPMLATNKIRLQSETISDTVKISELPEIEICTTNDYLPIVQEGETKKLCIEVLKTDILNVLKTDILNTLNVSELLFSSMSDYETFTFSNVNTPVPYNGFISFVLSVRGGAIRNVYVNDIIVGGCNNAHSTDYLGYDSCMVAVKKGDMVRGGTANMKAYARWFKDDV